MKEDFADIFTGGKIKLIEAMPEARQADDEAKLLRIAFGFDCCHYGRLRQLLDVLNALPANVLLSGTEDRLLNPPQVHSRISAVPLDSRVQVLLHIQNSPTPSFRMPVGEREYAGLAVAHGGRILPSGGVFRIYGKVSVFLHCECARA